MDKLIEWNPEKNRTLQQSRQVSFEDVKDAIENGHLITVVNHPNQKKYPKQRIFYVLIRDYVYMAPFVEDDNKVFLKTIIPSRKANKKYNKKENI